MLRARVTRKFRDKYTGALHKVGEIIEITEERFAELIETSLGSFVEGIEEEAKISAAEDSGKEDDSQNEEAKRSKDEEPKAGKKPKPLRLKKR